MYSLGFSEDFSFFSPTARHWIAIIQSQRAALLNTKPQMEVLLTAIRQDIDAQFDEKQSEWKPLASYTIEKKKSMNADMRILHESTTGLRLRDAYAMAGTVTEAGKLIYEYPETKPYAVEHQKGTTDAFIDSGKKKKKKKKTALQKRADQLDDEYFDRFG